jgi:beta-glucanase (GH16 family)
VDADKQLSGGKATASVGTAGGMQIDFPKATAKTVQWAAYKPVIGRWDLRDFLEVRVVLKNTGQAAVTPRVCVLSNGGQSDWVEAKAPLAAGAQVELVIPFISASLWNGENPKKSGDQVTNDAVSGIKVEAHGADEARQVTIESVRADLPPAPELPAWLGKRPPVEGDWVKTFDDEFDGKAIDASKWNVTGENYWDKQSHFSHANTIIGDGVVKLRFEKKRGHQNDDPNHKRVTDYATGYLDTYGKWTQTYGYFEARMKLPTAPGLWPAFWMMPDRGGDGPQWKRASTENGGMEFDIMEYLTRWGPYRYNIAMHWDGYGKKHKATGSDKVYFQPDKEGFVTAGVLWTPGELVYYCNGREIGRWKNERISTVPADVMFTLPMGGWDNSPLDDEKLPDDFVIDYVRCWQRGDLAKGK